MIAYPVILTIATTDSGGGAGIQADLKTITVLGGYAASVVVALTAQNGEAVLGIHDLPPAFVRLQYEAIMKGFPVCAAKLGMLYSSPLIEAVAECLEGRTFPLVVDPVCVSQSGYKLLQDDAVDTMKRCIIPGTDLLTPNKPEAELLSGKSIQTKEDAEEAVKILLDMGAKAVLLKGGHFEASGESIIDWLGMPDQPLLPLPHARVETTDNHGTGCTLSAAIATGLGMGLPLQDAIEGAQVFLTKALASSFQPGRGPGAPNFLGGIR